MTHEFAKPHSSRLLNPHINNKLSLRSNFVDILRSQSLVCRSRLWHLSSQDWSKTSANIMTGSIWGVHQTFDYLWEHIFYNIDGMVFLLHYCIDIYTWRVMQKHQKQTISCKSNLLEAVIWATAFCTNFRKLPLLTSCSSSWTIRERDR